MIVVGNLVAGGSGKTPLALWIAEHLKAKGWSPAIVSRGYGGSAEQPREATIASDPSEVGDEPMLLARRSGCPVWVGRDRSAAIAAMRGQHPDCNVVILDDGLQHYRLARDIEIAVVDARGFGNGFLLPAGPLREPPARLRTVSAAIANESDKGEVERHARGRPVFAMAIAGEELHRATDARDRRTAGAFAGQRVHAVAGIAEPGRFFRYLEKFAVRPVPHPFPDHHPFRPEDLEFGDDAPVLMTEKDAVKCKRFARPHHWVLPVHAAPERAFGDWLSKELDKRKHA